MPSKKKGQRVQNVQPNIVPNSVPSISSNHLPVFLVQALIVATLVLSATAVIYTIFYGTSKMPNLTTSQAPNGPVTQEQIADKPVDESMFNQAPASIDPQKLENLFPELK